MDNSEKAIKNTLRKRLEQEGVADEALGGLVDEIWQMTDRYARYKKKAGARSMAKLVRQMRDKQKRYFQCNKNGGLAATALLKESKALEQQVDRAVQAVLNQST